MAPGLLMAPGLIRLKECRVRTCDLRIRFHSRHMYQIDVKIRIIPVEYCS